jgi:aspartyl-tRNA(Asn)/glutamyl-tRNA(Gln) amidotransferase subunit A
MPIPEQDNPVTRQTMAYLAAIDRTNSGLRAFTDVLAAQAMATARACDANPIGPLCGMNIAIKDNIDTAPARCIAGLPHLQGRRASEDAAVVASLRAAGAVILGVTATDSGAFGVTTPEVTNPAMPGHIAGGSSGGSAVAVAARLCDAALGTDTGGSVRIPAACCGVYGFKPTHGTIPMAGIRPLTDSFDHVGIMARSITTIRKIAAVLAPQRPVVQPPGKPRIAIPWGNLAGTDPDILTCLHSLQSKLRSKGFTVVETVLPPLDAVLEVHIGLSLAEAATFYADLAAKDRQGLPDAMKTGLAMAQALTATQKSDLIARRATLLAAMDQIFRTTDHLLLPTLPIQPPLIGASTVMMGAKPTDTLNALIRFTAPFNQTGHPALAFPWQDPESGLSCSLQLVGQRHSDLLLLDFANTF